MTTTEKLGCSLLHGVQPLVQQVAGGRVDVQMQWHEETVEEFAREAPTATVPPAVLNRRRPLKPLR